jgi:hypothetical protein
MKTMTTSSVLGRLSRSRVSLAVVLAAIAATLATTALHLNVIDVNLRLLENIERNQVDELMAIWLVAACAIGFEIRHRRRLQIESERVRVLKATMRTVHDIVGNSLNNLQLLRLEAEGFVSVQALSIFDDSIQSTMAQLRALTELDTFAEQPMAFGPGLDLGDRMLLAA